MINLMSNENKIYTLLGKGFPTIKTWYEKIKELGLEDGYACIAITEKDGNNPDFYINKILQITNLISWKEDKITGKSFILICGKDPKHEFIIEENSIEVCNESIN